MILLLGVTPNMKKFFKALEKLFRLGLAVIVLGSSFHNFGPENRIKPLSEGDRYKFTETDIGIVIHTSSQTPIYGDT